MIKIQELFELGIISVISPLFKAPNTDAVKLGFAPE
jgi:hypothetical protein